jgi:hypothetical protein
VRCFDDKCWAYHCGNPDRNKYGIGVEYELWGGLKLVDGLYLPWTNRPNQAVPADSVVKLPQAWRGFEYFERLTDAQIEAGEYLITLLKQNHPKLTEDCTHADLVNYKTDFPPDADKWLGLPRLRPVIKESLTTEATVKQSLTVQVNEPAQATDPQTDSGSSQKWLVRLLQWILQNLHGGKRNETHT